MVIHNYVCTYIQIIYVHDIYIYIYIYVYTFVTYKLLFYCQSYWKYFKIIINEHEVTSCSLPPSLPSSFPPSLPFLPPSLLRCRSGRVQEGWLWSEISLFMRQLQSRWPSASSSRAPPAARSHSLQLYK